MTESSAIEFGDPESQQLHARLLEALNQHALIKGPVRLASGQMGTYYVDIKRLSLYGDRLALLSRLMWTMIRDSGAEAIGGLTLGADPIIAGVILAAAQDGDSKVGLIVRKEAKEHGTAKLIEGPMHEGIKVAVVEDVTTTGGSAIRAAETLQAAGAEVVGVYTVLNRQAGADASFAAKGWKLRSIFTADDLDV